MLIPKREDPHYFLNEQLSAPEYPRPYLGLSTIGEKCLRKLQYDHYWAYKSSISTRIQRLFNVGHAAESLLIAEIEKLGYMFSNEQYVVAGVGGHWIGHIDGIASNEQHDMLGEFKTHNDKNFKELKKKKVKEAFPKHHHQMNAYMGYVIEQGHFYTNKALYVAINKNDSEIYIEIIDFDPELFKEQKRKQSEVIMSDVLLPRIGTDTPTWFECKMCPALNVCFGRAPVEKNVRTSKFVDVEDGGRWTIDEIVVPNEVHHVIPANFEYSEMFK